MTQQDALNWINGEWRSSRFAKTIPGVGTGIDADNLYGFQCKDFANGFADFMGNPFGGGNAIALWNVAQPGWHKVNAPQPGDVFVRNYTSGGINYGDTGIVKSVSGNRITVVQQNLAGNLKVGSPPAETTYNQNIMLGYLRNDRIGDSMNPLTRPLIEQLFVAILHRKPDENDFKAWTGLPWTQLMDSLYHSDEWAIQDNALKHPSGGGQTGVVLAPGVYQVK